MAWAANKLGLKLAAFRVHLNSAPDLQLEVVSQHNNNNNQHTPPVVVCLGDGRLFNACATYPSIKEVPPTNAIDMTKKGAKVFSGYTVMRSWSSIRSSE